MLYPCFIQPTTRTIAYTLLISVYLFRHIIFARGFFRLLLPCTIFIALEFNPGRTVTAFGLTHKSEVWSYYLLHAACQKRAWLFIKLHLLLLLFSYGTFFSTRHTHGELFLLFDITRLRSTKKICLSAWCAWGGSNSRPRD